MPASDLERISAALAAAGARYLVVAGVAVVLHGHPRFTPDLDLALALDPANVFEAAWARHLRADLEGAAVEVVSLDDLIGMRRRAGRPQDLADVRELEAIAREHRGRGDG